MEKRLSLTIDPSKAKKGAGELNKVLSELEKKAKNISKALGDLSTAEKFLDVTKKTSKSVRDTTKSTNDYENALNKAEKAIQANYHTVKLLNGEVGKELELSKKMVANKKLEFEATSKEAKAIRELSVATKANLTNQDALVKAKEKLTYVQSQEYKELQKLNAEIKKHETAVRNAHKPVKTSLTEQEKLVRKLAQAKEKLTLVNSKEFKELHRVRKELETAEKSVKGLDTQSRNLQRTMMGIGIAASMFSGSLIIQELSRTLDVYTELQNKLAVVTGSTEGLTKVTDDLIRVSIDSRTTLEATVDLYSKLSRVNKEYGYSQQELLLVTESVAKAVGMSGATAQAAEGAVIQFAQALAGNFKTAGQELNSVIEQTPGLAEALAEGLTKLGTIGDVTSSRLKKLASEGLIDTKDVIEGLIVIYPELSEKFELSSGTIANSINNVGSAFTAALGRIDKAAGITKTVTNDLDEFAKAILGSEKAIGALTGLLTGGAITAIVGTAVALTSLVGAVPIALGAGFIGLSAWLGSIAAESAEASERLKTFTKDIENLDKVVSGATTRDQAGSMLENYLSELDSLDKTLDESEAKLVKLKKAYEASTSGWSGSKDKSILKQIEELNAQIDIMYINRKKLQETVAVLSIKSRDESLPENDKARLEAERLTKQLETYITTEDKAIKAIKERDKALRLIADTEAALIKSREHLQDPAQKGLTDKEYTDLLKARELAWKKYYEAIKGKGVKKTLADLGDSFNKFRSSLVANNETFGKSEQIAAIYNNRLRAMETTEADYAAQLKQGIVTREQVDKAIRTNQDNVEGLTKSYYKLVNAQKRTDMMNQVTGSSFSNWTEEVRKGRQDFLDLGGSEKEADKYAAQLARSTSQGFTDGLVQAIDSDSTEAAMQLFSGTLGNLVGQGVTNALTASLGASVAGPVGAFVGSAVTYLLSDVSDTIETTFEERQRSQGTGSVLGDNYAQSKSIADGIEQIAESTDQLVGINTGMLDALRTVQLGISGASTRIARSGTGTFGAFDDSVLLQNSTAFKNTEMLLDVISFGTLGSIANKILGGSSRVSDRGLLLQGGNLNQAGNAVGYQDTSYKKYRWGSTRTRTDYSLLDSDINRQFQAVFDSIADSVYEGAITLGLSGDEVEKSINEFVVAAQRISLMNLSLEDQQKQLEAVFSKIFDDVTASVIPFLTEMQRAGEGLGETLARVATNVLVTETAVDKLGFYLGNLIPEEMAKASTALVDLAGGASEFTSLMNTFIDNFYSDSQKFTLLQNDLTKAFRDAGLQLPKTKQGYLELLQAQDAGTDVGRQNINTLLELNSVSAEYYSQLEEQAKLIRNLKDSFSLTGTDQFTSFIDRFVNDNYWEQTVQSNRNSGFGRRRRTTTETITADTNQLAEEAAKKFTDSFYNALADAATYGDLDAAKQLSSSLFESFLDSYYTEAEKLSIQQDNLLSSLTDYSSLGITVDSSIESIKKLYETTTDPSTLADILVAADLLAQYNEVISQGLSEDVINGINVSLDALKDSIRQLEDLSKSLENAIKGSVIQSEELDKARLASARAQITMALATAEATGDLSNLNLDYALATVAGDTQKFYGSFEEYARASAATTRDITDLNTIVEGQLTTEEETLKVLEDQLELINSGNQEALKFYSDLLKNSTNQLETLKLLVGSGDLPTTNVAGFNDGGVHTGGLRIVGETAPEIEYTKPSVVYNNRQASTMMDMSGVVSEIRQLRAELRAQASASVFNSSKMRTVMERWDGQGLPTDRGY